MTSPDDPVSFPYTKPLKGFITFYSQDTTTSVHGTLRDFQDLNYIRSLNEGELRRINDFTFIMCLDK